MKKTKLHSLMSLAGIKEQLPKGVEKTHLEWFDQMVVAANALDTVYSIAAPSVWEHHEALGLDDLREVVLLRKRKRELIKVWNARPFKAKP